MWTQWCVQLLGYVFKEKWDGLSSLLFYSYQLEFDILAEAGAAVLDHKMKPTWEGYQSNKMEGAKISDTRGLHINCTSYPLLVSAREIDFYLVSVHFSRSVVSNCLWPHGLQHSRPPCPSPTSRACSNSCPSSQWCHPTISSSVIPFSSCFQSFPASGCFPMTHFFESGILSIGVSDSASILPVSIRKWFPLG